MCVSAIRGKTQSGLREGCVESKLLPSGFLLAMTLNVKQHFGLVPGKGHICMCFQGYLISSFSPFLPLTYLCTNGQTELHSSFQLMLEHLFAYSLHAQKSWLKVCKKINSDSDLWYVPK